MGLLKQIIKKAKGLFSPSQPMKPCFKMGNNKGKIMSTNSISYHFYSLRELLDDELIEIFALNLNISESTIRNDLSKVTEGMRKDLVCLVEYPYVDECYRDTYYAYYSRLHNSLNRFCIRISFFLDSIDTSDFYSEKIDSSKYLGYTVLRPTHKRCIGYTFLSPLIYTDNDFSLCLCNKISSIMGRKLKVYGFPFCGQDNVVMSCSETSLYVLLDYFSRRYHRYRHSLPSEIISTAELDDYQKEFPSRGLDEKQVAHVLHNNRFSVRTYYKEKDTTERYIDTVPEGAFYKYLSTYVDSGFPVLAFTNSHAIIIIGKANHTSNRYVVMDEGSRPYSYLNSLEDIESFIVPLPDRIYLDIENINEQEMIRAICKENPKFESKADFDDLAFRIFLAPSGSYKDYIARSSITKEAKDIFISSAMPRFIWVCEAYDKSYSGVISTAKEVKALIVIDATQRDTGQDFLIIAKNQDKILFLSPNVSDKRIYMIWESEKGKDNLLPYRHNLKGVHTKWQNS